jgi:hypothetical protein
VAGTATYAAAKATSVRIAFAATVAVSNATRGRATALPPAVPGAAAITVAISAVVAIPAATSIPLIARVATSAAFAPAASVSVPATTSAIGIPVASAVSVPCAPASRATTVPASRVAIAVPVALATPISVAASIAAAVPVTATVSAPAAIALGKRRPVQDGQAGPMAEVQLNANGKGNSNACNREEGMSPPACHVSSAHQQLGRLPNNPSATGAFQQMPTWRVAHAIRSITPLVPYPR